MKQVYIILAFHAHEMLWELPEKLMSHLPGNNPMQDTFLDENYLKKRKEEGRDVYSLSLKLGEKLKAPICVEFSNELLHQIGEVMPDTFEKLKEGYSSGRLYPIYGHAHHTHISLLDSEEAAQEIRWNMEFVHKVMGAPYPGYKGLFPPEASFDSSRQHGMFIANVDYVIFPHLSPEKVFYEITGDKDCIYRPFLIQAGNKELVAFPRNFPISQEIWRPITRMKREEVKFQGYMLGTYPVFDNEYALGVTERFPISMEEGIAIYKSVLSRELHEAPDGGVLVYIQDLELMDFGELALEIMSRAWVELLEEIKEEMEISFITPDYYLDKLLEDDKVKDGFSKVNFDKICWAPEIRLILRVDGHYPPLGAGEGQGYYDPEKTGLFSHPHIFWENGKYFCGIFNDIMSALNILPGNIPVSAGSLSSSRYDIMKEEPGSALALLLRLMKRACNWGWRPTEGRQKRPCLKGYLFCSVLLEKMERVRLGLLFGGKVGPLNERNIAGLVETLNIFIDGRLDYLLYATDQLAEKEGFDISSRDKEIRHVWEWKRKAVSSAAALYRLNVENKPPAPKMKGTLQLIQDYCQAVFMATDHLQRIWSLSTNTDFMVEKMYEYLYRIYPPLFPAIVEKIDSMNEKEIQDYFSSLEKGSCLLQ